jgi:biopolymer transport protein ExbD
MNVTPLVDVVLVLLIIFMVVAPQLEQDVPVDLPGIVNVDPEVEGNMDPLKVSMAEPGQYHIDGQQFDLEGILKHLGEQYAVAPNRRLLLRADAKLQYGDIRQFMARVQQMGFPGMNFMVGERHKEGAVRATATYGSEHDAQVGAMPAVDGNVADPAGTPTPAEVPPAGGPAAEPAPAEASGS